MKSCWSRAAAGELEQRCARASTRDRARRARRRGSAPVGSQRVGSPPKVIVVLLLRWRGSSPARRGAGGPPCRTRRRCSQRTRLARRAHRAEDPGPGAGPAQGLVARAGVGEDRAARDRAAGRQDAHHLADRLARVGEAVQAREGDDEVEGAVVEGQRADVGHGRASPGRPPRAAPRSRARARAWSARCRRRRRVRPARAAARAAPRPIRSGCRGPVRRRAACRARPRPRRSAAGRCRCRRATPGRPTCGCSTSQG